MKATLLSILGIVIVLALGLGWYFGIYATANTRGRVALHNQINTPSQIQFNYEYFHNTCHDIVAKTQQLANIDKQIQEDQKQLATANDPFGQQASQPTQLKTDRTGLANSRDQAAQDYNSKSNQFTRNYMKSKDLPALIGPPSGINYDALTCEGQNA